jgi:hypothetical protein
MTDLLDRRREQAAAARLIPSVSVTPSPKPTMTIADAATFLKEGNIAIWPLFALYEISCR